MNSDRFRRCEELFHAVMSLAENERVYEPSCSGAAATIPSS